MITYIFSAIFPLSGDCAASAKPRMQLGARRDLLLPAIDRESLGRPFKLTPHQQKEAMKRRDTGKETLAEIGRSYDVSAATISRLLPNSGPR
jgi:hypothetical protein